MTTAQSESLVSRIVEKNVQLLMNDFSMDMESAFGIKVCVEGVETAEELECVKALGADCIQGYYYGKPMPADEFESKFIRN